MKLDPRNSSLLPFLATVCIAATDLPPVQSDSQFKAAFSNHSSSNSFIEITVTDERSGKEKTGCTTPATLTHAIELEQGLIPVYSYDGPSAKIALTARNHSFVFANKEALDAIFFERFETLHADACRIINAGHPAYQEDRTGKVRLGQP